jgi:phosphoribosyl-AMP cyclohydrolase
VAKRKPGRAAGKEFPDRLPKRVTPKAFLAALKFDAQGLVTVVAQDAANGEILMLAHADRTALEKSLRTGYMHYFSRSRMKLWKKGEDSGHLQALVSLAADCDGDALVAKVKQVKGACHLGLRSCFAYQLGPKGYRNVGRKVFDPAAAYTKRKRS